MSNNFCKSQERQALTLVEVITSIALLSTLLVGMLTAYNRHVRQLSRASDIQVAVKLSDQLMSEWFRSDEPISEHRLGVFSSNPEFSWQLSIKPAGTERQLGARILLFEVFKINGPQPKSVMSLELLDTIREEDGN